MHRQLPGQDIYWVNNRKNEWQQVEATFRVDGKLPELWHPEMGKVEPASYTTANGRASVTLNLIPHNVVFVVFSENASRATVALPDVKETQLSTLDNCWAVAFQTQRGAPAQIKMERQGDAFGSLLMAMGIAVLFVYLIMVALYDSFIYPFIVLFSLPVALIGALLVLALAFDNRSIFSMIGMIMLMGLVAKNAILLVDFINKLKAEGVPVREALIEAGRERLRPILMTTLAMVFGMLPIALASGAGAEMKNGLAWVIIGSLTSSLLLTLVLVPSVYLTVENAMGSIKARFGKKDSDLSPSRTQTAHAVAEHSSKH